MNRLSRASSESSSGSETETPLSAGLGGSDEDRPRTIISSSSISNITLKHKQYSTHHHHHRSHSPEATATAQHVDLSWAWCRASRAEVLMFRPDVMNTGGLGWLQDHCQSRHGRVGFWCVFVFVHDFRASIKHYKQHRFLALSQCTGLKVIKSCS